MSKLFTDKEIIEGILSRDERICNQIARQLHEENKRIIMNLVLKNSGKKEDAEDLEQEVLIAFFNYVWAGRFILQDNTQIKTFLYAIAYKKWMKQLKKEGRKMSHEVELENEIIDDQRSPIHALIEQEELNIAQKIFNKLGKICQEILKAYYMEEKSMEEIALQFNFTNADTAKVRKFRCMKQLSNLI
ncbi:RNA polymerase sigma factor [Emticicia sp. 17c]|uniref:RNA polymerase sigma factor n=1 Tax=Emticicia sp. 17c TaxID=3127704 RepID=UPI00301BD91F